MGSFRKTLAARHNENWVRSAHFGFRPTLIATGSPPITYYLSPTVCHSALFELDSQLASDLDRVSKVCIAKYWQTSHTTLPYLYTPSIEEG